jgi:hypothetical protein
MKITQKELKEFLELEKKVKELSQRKDELRDAILNSGKDKVGDYKIIVMEAQREIAKPKDQIIQDFGLKVWQGISKISVYKKLKVVRQ